MWENPIAKENVAKLEKLGYQFIGPEAGWLACRNVGVGRMSDPEKIVQEVTAMLSAQKARPSSPSSYRAGI
jgi:phosphopantothenoylcysteine synthetase/decarboxylase